MSIEERLNAGIAAAMAGDREKASAFLIEVVRADPNSELGWLWLGHCRTEQKQREYCFRRVLAINPHNTEARRKMGFVQAQVSPSPAIKPLKVPDTTNSATPSQQPSGRNTASPPKLQGRGHKLLWASSGLALFLCVAFVGIYLVARLATRVSTPVPAAHTSAPTATLVIPTPTPSYQPTFEEAACPFQPPTGARVDCGYVIVPEDRGRDLNDTIRIAVAIYGSTSSAPHPDPIIYLQGGPGGEAISWSVHTYQDVIAPLLAERDFIIFDPRGVGYSEPALDCEEFGETYIQDLQGQIPAEQRPSYYEGAMLVCKNNLVSQGVNLSAYTSVDMAADVRDVLVALGYPPANLYGISYGTRVAQFVMRNHPEVVRSVILDSVVPVEIQLFNQSPTESDDILQGLFADCLADPVCAAAYPDLGSVYQQVFDQLNTQPIPVTVSVTPDKTLEQTIDGYTFRNAVMWMLRTPETIALAPRLIYHVRDGDHSTLVLSLSLPVLAFDGISMGSYISVSCHDQLFAMSIDDSGQAIADLCNLWDIDSPLPGENDPVNSEIPALIFAGRYDTTTPPSFARQLAAHLPHSYVAEIPNEGHAPSASGLTDCPTNVIGRFLQDPTRAPDMTCVGEIPPTKFVVPYTGNPPLNLEPVSSAQYQVNTAVPTGWSEVGNGFYNRDEFIADMTQIGVQSTPFAESAWIAWLSTNFGGELGFDQPATNVEQYQANGLTWSIYRASAQGLEIDIAFASEGQQTLMVLLVSYPDEHDALYQTVFLPILDSTIALK